MVHSTAKTSLGLPLLDSSQFTTIPAIAAPIRQTTAQQKTDNSKPGTNKCQRGITFKSTDSENEPTVYECFARTTIVSVHCVKICVCRLTTNDFQEDRQTPVAHGCRYELCLERRKEGEQRYFYTDLARVKNRYS